MQEGRRFRIYPTRDQGAALRRWMGAQRFVYNAKIDSYRYEAWLRRHAILSPNWRDPSPEREGIFNQRYSHFRATNAWMKEVPAEVLRNGVFRYRQAVIKAGKGAGAPVIKRRGGSQSVMLTRELFRFEEGSLRVASRKEDLGIIRWKAHREFSYPAMMSITVEADGSWYAGFSFDSEVVQPAMEPLPEGPQEVLGIDLGVVQAVTTSDGAVIHPSHDAQERYEGYERKARRLQRKLSRQVKGSRNREKTKRRVARVRSKQAHLRNDFAHKTSRRLCQGPHVAIAFEDLQLKNLTAAPKPRPNESGGWDPNGAAAKAALNASLLRWSLGQIRSFTAYKAGRAGKHFVLVPSAHSSQECSCCHFSSPLNRLTQAEFICQACGFTINADHNGASIVAQRGHTILSAGNRQITQPVEPPIREAVKQEALCES